MSMFGGYWLHVDLQGPPKIMINLMRMRMMRMTMMEFIFLNSGFGQCFVDLLTFPGTVAGMAEGNWIRRPRRGAAVLDPTPELSESSILVSIDN